MRIRTQLRAFALVSLVLGLAASLLVFAAGRREDAAGDAQSRAQVTEHEVAGLLALTQEYARYAEPRAAQQWHLRHGAIVKTLEGDAQGLTGPALAELRSVAHELPVLFSRLQELPPGTDAFTLRRKEVLLDQLLTNTQAMSDYAYQWFQDAVVMRREAEREFRWIAFSAPGLLLAMLMACGLVVRQRVLLPMRRLDQAAAAIRRGDLSSRLGTASRDEFGELAREFDAMTAALVESDRLRDLSEQQLRDITDNLPALVAYVDRDGIYRFANEKYQSWLGHDPCSMLGRHVAEVLGPASFDEMKERIESALRGDRVQWARTIEREGREAHLLVDYIPHWEDGVVKGCYALSIDMTERRAAELRMVRSEQRMIDLTNAIPAMVGYFDMQGRCQYANDAGLRSQGLSRADAQGMGLRQVLGETNYAQHEPYVREVLQGRRARLEGKIGFAGREAHFQAHLIPDRLDGGAQRGFYLMTFDITALKEAEARQGRVERQLRAITDNLPVAITYLDHEQRYRFVNRTGLDWLQRPHAQVIGQRIDDVVQPTTYAELRQQIGRALEGERVTFEADVHTGGTQRQLHYIYVPDVQSDGTVSGLYGLASDVSELKKVQYQLSQLVRSDALTGLANRYQFNESMPAALARARRGDSAVAVMYLDIDHFKSINDSLGHAAGDEVLKAFAQRVAQSVRETDTVARLGGDEFVVILEGLHDEREPRLVARKIIDSVTRPLRVAGRPLSLTTSIGVAYCDRVGSADADTARDLLARADEALYAAKGAGRNTYRVLSGGAAVMEAAL